MSNPTERYQKLGYKDALLRSHDYPTACKELSLILREAYNNLHKNLQSVVFHDTLAAFRLLPQMQTRSAVSAAHLLLQSAEAALPKQKKTLAVTEFKQAKVAHKRRRRVNQEEQSAVMLPLDVLVHIFSFLDIQSLVSAGLVCWSWNFAASSNQLWESLYSMCFGRNCGNAFKTKKWRNGRTTEDEELTYLQGNMSSQTSVDWKETFKKAYIGDSSKRLTSNRGYCDQCETIVWLDNMKCSDRECRLQSGEQQIVHVSSHQVVGYLLDGSSAILFSSDSDSESDEGHIPRLWSYPRFIERCHIK